MAAVIAAMSAFSGMPCMAAGSATPRDSVPLAGGWSARFFVSPTQRSTGLPDDAVIRRNLTLGVNAQLSRRIARDTRFSVEVTNAFDRESSVDTGLVPPAAGRGIQLGVRTTFK